MQRANYLNPTAVQAWFNMVQVEIVECRLLSELIFGMDESGFPPTNDASLQCIGCAGKKSQFRHGGASRENVTALVTICADGTWIEPLVIFKAKYIMSK